jgi:hypothetical protein
MRTLFFIPTLVLAAPAFADNPKPAAPPPFGAAKDSLVCEQPVKDLGVNKCQSAAKDHLKPDCLAESTKRIDECKKRPDDAKPIKEICDKAGFGFEDGVKQTRKGKIQPTPEEALDAYCRSAVWFQMSEQVKIASVTMPVAAMHDAAIEKAIWAAYAKAYPDTKIVKVVITSTEFQDETDAFGAVIGRNVPASVVNKHKDGTCEVFDELWLQKGSGKRFSGPFEERGAGSLSRAEIECSLVK